VKCLLHCILETLSALNEQVEFPDGHSQPLFMVANNNGLSAVVSHVAQDNRPPEISQLVAYEKVVDWFFLRQTVIPMRYGCLFKTESQIVKLLDERKAEYHTLLRKLASCLEMGVRVIPPAHKADEYHAPDLLSGPGTATNDLTNATGLRAPGRAYLATRYACYADENIRERENAALLAQCRERLTGLFHECRTEIREGQTGHAKPPGPLLFLHFLVPLHGLGAFRETFQRLNAAVPASLLLSGPWPPYNFVTADNARTGARDAVEQGSFSPELATAINLNVHSARA